MDNPESVNIPKKAKFFGKFYYKNTIHLETVGYCNLYQ